MIRFRCPACDKAHEAPDNLAGTKGPCPSCGQRLQFPFPVPVAIVENPKPTANDPVMVQVSAKLLCWPRSCACCMGTPDVEYLVTCTRTSKKKQEQQCWRVPYCSACLAHVRTQNGAKADCCTMGPAIVYDNWHGTVHTFRFLSRGYAAAFREANSKKLLG